MAVKIMALVIALLLVAIVAMTYTHYYILKPQAVRNARTAMWVDSFLKVRNGWTAYKNYGSYLLVSFDCGKTWYSAKYTDHKPVQTPDMGFVSQFGYTDLTPADPELIEHLDNFDVLIDLAKRSADPNNPVHRKVLEKAGFNVIVK